MVELFSDNIPYASGYGRFQRNFTTSELNDLITACGQYDLIALEFVKSDEKIIQSETVSANALLKAFTESYELKGGVPNYTMSHMSGIWSIGISQNAARVYWYDYSQDGTLSLKIYGIK